MSNEEILKRAIKKSIENGFKTTWYRNGILLNGESYGDILEHEGLYDIIFSHDFAKAFWGVKTSTSSDGLVYWKWRLAKMVLEEQPIKYLEKFL